jgi:hypothetical protein
LGGEWGLQMPCSFLSHVHLQHKEFAMCIEESFSVLTSCPFCKELLVETHINWPQICSFYQQCFYIPGRLVPSATALLACPSTWPDLELLRPNRTGCCHQSERHQKGKWAGKGLHEKSGPHTRESGVQLVQCPLKGQTGALCRFCHHTSLRMEIHAKEIKQFLPGTWPCWLLPYAYWDR